jgi:hypothetical protein
LVQHASSTNRDASDQHPWASRLETDAPFFAPCPH